MATGRDSWFPLFEFQDWTYQSFLLLPTPEENNALPGNVVTAKKWAMGTLVCGQALKTDDGYVLDGKLSFSKDAELSFSAKGTFGSGNAPATFEATGIGKEDRTKGAIYHLVGWVFPELPVAHGAAKVLSVRGSVQAIRGPDSKPDIELGRMPIGTVGAFVIARTVSTE